MCYHIWLYLSAGAPNSACYTCLASALPSYLSPQLRKPLSKTPLAAVLAMFIKLGTVSSTNREWILCYKLQSSIASLEVVLTGSHLSRSIGNLFLLEPLFFVSFHLLLCRRPPSRHSGSEDHLALVYCRYICCMGSVWAWFSSWAGVSAKLDPLLSHS